MSDDTDLWRDYAHAPPRIDPEPDEHGLIPAGDQDHTIPQAEAAEWVREFLALTASSDPAERDDGFAVVAAFKTHLTPLCQLGGVMETAARVLRLAYSHLENVADKLHGRSLTLEPWLFRVTALRTGNDGDSDQIRVTPDSLWEGVCDYARFRGAPGDDWTEPELAGSETDLRLTALFTAAASRDTPAMAALVDSDLSWPAVSQRMVLLLSRLTWAAGHMFDKPQYDAQTVLEMSVFDTAIGDVPDLAAVLRQGRPDLDPGAFFGDGPDGG